MTLIITALLPSTICQSADFRLVDGRTGAPWVDSSTKLLRLEYGGWSAVVSYTGIGAVGKQTTSEIVLSWLSGLDATSPEDVAVQIAERGGKWLSAIGRQLGGIPRHTFLLSSFDDNCPSVTLISNFENTVGRSDYTPSGDLEISTLRYDTRPRLLISGCKDAVGDRVRRQLERRIKQFPDDPARVRRLLATANSIASRSQAAMGMVSAKCSVISVRPDGQGYLESEVEVKSMAFGMPMPDLSEVLKTLGFKGQLRSATFASSRPRVAYDRCVPRVAYPESPSSQFSLTEIVAEGLENCESKDLNDAGIILGGGHAIGDPARCACWTSSIISPPTIAAVVCKPVAINAKGTYCAEAITSDRSNRGVRLEGDNVFELGCYGGRDSFASAMNSHGHVAGAVCISATDRGQRNFRPAVWTSDSPLVLADFGCDWGQAVRITDDGLVLVVGYIGREVHAFLWDSHADSIRLVGQHSGVYPLAINRDGVVLGKGTDRSGRTLACIAKGDAQWEALGTEPDFYATCLSDAGEVAGAVEVDGFERPWLRTADGSILWLPYFEHHFCRPQAINSARMVVGTARTDHGCHALAWKLA